MRVVPVRFFFHKLNSFMTTISKILVVTAVMSLALSVVEVFDTAAGEKALA